MKEPKLFRYLKIFIAGFIGLTVICSPAISKAQQEERLLVGTPEGASKTVDHATLVIQDMLKSESEERLPPEILQKAAGIAVIPNLVKAGFIPGGRHGSGVLLANENNGWSPPIFLSITGGNIGAQIGITSTDLVLVFTNRDTIDRLKDGGSLALGLDASMEAGPSDPIGGGGAENIEDPEIFAYSRSEGPVEGISLTGSTLALDRDTTLAFYEEGIEDTARAYYGKERRLTDDLLSIERRAGIKIPPTGENLQDLLKDFASNRSGK